MKNKFSKRIRTYLENKSFTWQMTNAILVLSFFLLIIAGVIWTKIKTIEFKQDKARLQSEYIESQKQLIETEVNRSMAYIKYRRSLTIEQMKSQLKVRVDGAWQIANNIYLENRNRKPAAEIQQMIKDAIRPLRFANERGDVFIYTVEGVAVMLPRSREQEGKP
ncbi:MAG: cache domain-containing protein, partial [Lentimicrobium sp.]|nr:cache domain-containing protein [Lentimicrobium sp.]